MAFTHAVRVTPVFMAVLTASCLVNEKTSSFASTGPGFLTSPSFAAAEELATAGALQQQLDRWCQEEFVRLCDKKYSSFCNRTAVARFGKGVGGQQTNEWRCYDAHPLQSSKREVQCVDNCGNHIPCLGAVNASTTNHASRPSEITKLLDEQVRRFCSSFQNAADNVCSAKRNGSVARKGLGEDGRSSGDWACYKKDSLVYEAPAVCANNCGEDVGCVGGPSSGVGGAQTSDVEEIRAIMTDKSGACPSASGCVSTVVNPPLCLTEGETGSPADNDMSHESRRLDEIETLCRGNNDASCSGISSQKVLCPKSPATGGVHCFPAVQLGGRETPKNLDDCIICSA
ncbi:microneme protein MIC13 [Besnoitia besnoiti]|uniref:Microneme protein MIC13 n=1 Tax=Besnoitia besnoiti TaxID=94643 RepID=A0A2A9MCI8_BESBE|nr:microneme protein MIC13 [Besnoitia besnoiti]PFH34031.1 microneme protein MIC13 [Besnoitia besnoiti]